MDRYIVGLESLDEIGVSEDGSCMIKFLVSTISNHGFLFWTHIAWEGFGMGDGVPD